MLAQSSSAEVFFDNIRQELRVTSVHHCNSLKSLGKIIGAVTVAFLEEEAKYDTDEADEVQSSDQVSQFLLDRSKVWGGIPASLSFIPMPGSSKYGDAIPQQLSPVSRSDSEVESVPQAPSRVKSETGSCKRSVPEIVSSANDLCELSVPERKSNGEGAQPSTTGNKKPPFRDSSSFPRKAVGGPCSDSLDRYSEDCRSVEASSSHVSNHGNIERDHKKLSSPSVSNSGFSHRKALCGKDVRTLQYSAAAKESSRCHSSDSEHSQNGTSKQFGHILSTPQSLMTDDEHIEQRPFHKNIRQCKYLPEESHGQDRLDCHVEDVLIKAEVYDDLCNSSVNMEDSTAGDNKDDDSDDQDEDMLEECDVSSQDHSALFRQSDLSLSTYALGEMDSPFMQAYPTSVHGETTFPGIPVMDPLKSAPASSVFPHGASPSAGSVLRWKNFVGHGESMPHIDSSSLHGQTSSFLPQYQSSLSRLHSKPHRKKTPNFPTCALCNAEIRDKNDFAAHASLHSVDYQQNCPVCLKIFSNRANLLRHASLHILGVLYQCPICCRMIKRGDNFQVHMRKQHPGQSVKMGRSLSGQEPGRAKIVYSGTPSSAASEAPSSICIGRPGSSSGVRHRYLSEGDVSRNRVQADSSCSAQTEAPDFIDETTSDYLCIFCANRFMSSRSLAIHMQDVHGRFSSVKSRSRLGVLSVSSDYPVDLEQPSWSAGTKVLGKGPEVDQTD
ncbi:zinc finger and BTB domain-containing protein 11-like [Haliotis cracherodii]|uniref:zinc finger and BTB domain-containing protein 11-like n=1 Tax=Haliotis cracherodii TaxID=6455 RepID=UPI0039E75B40